MAFDAAPAREPPLSAAAACPVTAANAHDSGRRADAPGRRFIAAKRDQRGGPLGFIDTDMATRITLIACSSTTARASIEL